MNEVLLIVGVIAGIAGLVIFVVAQKRRRREQRVIENLPVRLPAAFPYVTDAPGAPYIQSVVPVPANALGAIIEGIMTQIARIDSARPGWAALRRIEDYNVAFIDPTAFNLDGSPALIINGIQSAGTCIGVGNDGHVPTVIILPHQSASGWQHLEYLKASARHESEHAREWNNDQAEFWSFLGANDVHPHFP